MTSDTSPLTRLVRELDDGLSPSIHRQKLDPMSIRERIYRAAADELAYKSNLGLSYDPVCDARFTWLLQWAEVLEGIRRRIDRDIDACMRFLFMPVDHLLTGKDYASGERREPLTLAQGL